MRETGREEKCEKDSKYQQEKKKKGMTPSGKCFKYLWSSEAKKSKWPLALCRQL